MKVKNLIIGIITIVVIGVVVFFALKMTKKIQMRRKKKIIQMDVVVAAETIQVDAANLRD